MVILNSIFVLGSRFARSSQGNIAIIFALSLVPLISFVGAAIDYTRANAARSSMQAALNSTALMLSKDLSMGTISASEVNTKALAYFTALYNNKDAQNVSIAATYTPPTGSGASNIKVDGVGKITTDFMKVAGFPNMGFNTTSTATWGNVRMRVALVLDVTGSMADDGKMDAMKPAAKSLVDQLNPLAKNPGDIYISIVPFSKDVMMGASFKNADWIDWSDWDAANGSCSSGSHSSQSSCVNAGKTWTPKNHNTWTGCLTDRDQNFDTLNTAPTAANVSTLFPAEQYSYCDTSGAQIQPIMPLSYDWTALKSRIDSLVPTGNTNQGIGLASGLDDVDPERSLQRTGQGHKLHLQGCHRDPVGRLEHAEPLVFRRFADRRAPEDPVRQCQGRRHHDLHDPGQYGRRRDLGRAAILRAEHQQLLSGHFGIADGRGVQPDRHPALQATPFKIRETIFRACLQPWFEGHPR